MPTFNSFIEMNKGEIQLCNLVATKSYQQKKMYFSTHIVPISGASNRIIRIFVTFGTFTCIPAPTHTHTQNFMFPNLTDSQFHKHVVLTLRSVSKSFISVML